MLSEGFAISATSGCLNPSPNPNPQLMLSKLKILAQHGEPPSHTSPLHLIWQVNQANKLDTAESRKILHVTPWVAGCIEILVLLTLGLRNTFIFSVDS